MWISDSPNGPQNQRWAASAVACLGDLQWQHQTSLPQHLGGWSKWFPHRSWSWWIRSSPSAWAAASWREAEKPWCRVCEKKDSLLDRCEELGDNAESRCRSTYRQASSNPGCTGERAHWWEHLRRWRSFEPSISHDLKKCLHCLAFWMLELVQKLQRHAW